MSHRQFPRELRYNLSSEVNNARRAIMFIIDFVSVSRDELMARVFGRARFTPRFVAAKWSFPRPNQLRCGIIPNFSCFRPFVWIPLFDLRTAWALSFPPSLCCRLRGIRRKISFLPPSPHSFLHSSAISQGKLTSHTFGPFELFVRCVFALTHLSKAGRPSIRAVYQCHEPAR